MPDWYDLDFVSGYVTRRPLTWGAYWKGGPVLTVPAGFRFDMSVPRFLRWWASPHDPRYLLAACLHDYALSRGARRGVAAGLFEDALYASGVGRARRLVMWAAVGLWRWR